MKTDDNANISEGGINKSPGKCLVERLQNKSPLAAVMAKNKESLLEILERDNFSHLKAVRYAERLCFGNSSSSQLSQEEVTEDKSQTSNGCTKIIPDSTCVGDFQSEQSSLDQAMTAAITTCQTDLLEVLLNAGADIHCNDKWCPLIMTVVVSGNVKLFNIIKNYISNIRMESYYGSLLNNAIRSKSLQMVKGVFNKGIIEGKHFVENFQSQTDGLTPLHVAMQNIPYVCHRLLEKYRSDCTLDVEDTSKHDCDGLENIQSHNCDGFQTYDLRIIEFLLRNGIPIDATDNQGKTALHEAANYGNEELVHILLKAGADVYVHDNEGNVPWFYFLKSGNTHLLDLVFDIDDAEDQGYLHQMVKTGNWEGVKYLLSKKIDVLSMHKVDDYSPPLLLAVDCNSFDCIKELLNHSPNGLETPDDINATQPFQRALDNFNSYKSTSILELFLERGQNIDAVCECHCKTPLLEHIYNVETVKWLLGHGADPNFITPQGEFALLSLCCEGWDVSTDSEVLRLLLSHNADVSQTNRVDDQGWTALQLAIGVKGDYDFVKLCVAAGFSLYKIHDWLIEEQSRANSRGDEDLEPRFVTLLEYIKEREFIPVSLNNLSRLCILSCLGQTKMQEKIKCLGLPKILEDFLDWDKYLDSRCDELDRYLGTN